MKKIHGKEKSQKQKKDSKSLMYTFICIIGGVACIWASNPFEMENKSYFRGFPVNEPARWVIAIGGVIIILYSLFYKQSKSPSMFGYYEDSICTKCERVFLKGENPEKHICPDCKTRLESLEGFYDRHPELKDSDEELSKKYEDN